MSNSCNPMNCSLPGSSVHGILQARILEWVAISFSRGTSDPGIKPRSPALQQMLYQLSYAGKQTGLVAWLLPQGKNFQFLT